MTDSDATKIAVQEVWISTLNQKLDEVLHRIDRMEERFERRLDSGDSELHELIRDQDKRIRALELWRWGLLAASGAGATGSIGALLKALIGGS